MFFLAGSIVVIVCVIVGFLLAGGNLLLLWHPTEIIIICGAALGAFITSNPLKIVKRAFAGAFGLIKPSRYQRSDYVDLLNLLYDLLMKVRKEGMMSIEMDTERPQESKIFANYPRILNDDHMLEFITDCLRLMSGGNLEAHELEAVAP